MRSIFYSIKTVSSLYSAFSFCACSAVRGDDADDFGGFPDTSEIV
jgi:hypothetical protein